MKKILTFLIITTMLVLFLGCTQTDTSNNSDNNYENIQTPPNTNYTQPAANDTESGFEMGPCDLTNISKITEKYRDVIEDLDKTYKFILNEDGDVEKMYIDEEEILKDAEGFPVLSLVDSFQHKFLKGNTCYHNKGITTDELRYYLMYKFPIPNGKYSVPEFNTTGKWFTNTRATIDLPTDSMKIRVLEEIVDGVKTVTVEARDFGFDNSKIHIRLSKIDIDTGFILNEIKIVYPKTNETSINEIDVLKSIEDWEKDHSTAIDYTNKTFEYTQK